jgi:hypothetical protein
MSRRIVTGALLGLPAALLAHTFAFHGAHEAGGSMHGLLAILASGFGSVATLIAAYVALRKMRSAGPRLLPIVLGATAWFAGIECFEHTRDVPVAITLLALIVCSWLVRVILGAFMQTVVAVVATLWTALTKLPELRSNAIVLAAPALQRPAYRFRIFSRPPPHFS